MVQSPLHLTRRSLLRGVGALPLLGVLPLLAACRAQGAAQAPGEAAYGWLPPPGATPGSLLVVDLNGQTLDTQVAMAILQGLVQQRVHKGGEGLYLLLPNNYVGGVAFQGADARWLDVYQKAYGISSRSGQPGDALKLAKTLGVTQYVIWDPQVPATINVANTLAWLHGAAALPPSVETVNISAVLKGPAAEVAAAASGGGPLDLHGLGFKLLLDLPSLHFSDANAAYRWCLSQLGTVKPQALALISVGDMAGDATESVIRWTPRDYAVLTRAFTWIGDLNQITQGSHGGIVEAMLGLVAGRKATMFGWSNNEGNQTILCSSHGVNFVGADTPGLSAENLSVHAAISTSAQQHARPAAPALDPKGTYVTNVITDGDNISVLIDFHEGRWLDPLRGKVPVGWSLQGMSPSWTPGIARHYFDTATDQDEMVAWLPFGYPDLPSFVGHPNWPQYVASTQKAMKDAGLRVGQTLPHTGAVLTPLQSGLSDLLAGPDAPDGFLLGYTSIGGYPAGEPIWIHGRPMLPIAPLGASGATQAEQAIAAVQAVAAATTHRPLFVAVGLQNGTRYADAMQVAQASYPDGVHFVLPGQQVDLMQKARGAGLIRSAPVGLPAQYGNRDTYFLELAGDAGASSSGSVYLRGGTALQMRAAASGGGWTYGFDVEGAAKASASLLLTGAGSIQVGAQGKALQDAGSVNVAWGQLATLTVDLSALLPAQQVLVRFTPAANSTLGLLDMSLWYERVLAGAALPAQPQPVPAAQAAEIQLAAMNPAGVSLVLGSSTPSVELVQVGAHQGDSNFHVATVGGKSAEVFDPNTADSSNPTSYLYFVANVPGWIFPTALTLTVEYFDAPAGGTLQAMFDSPGPGVGGAYASSGGGVQCTGSGRWLTATFPFPSAKFDGRENFGADFRLAGTAGVAVHSISLSRQSAG